MGYALVQEGHAVFGVGRTAEEAILKATRLGNPEKIREALVPLQQASHGDLVVAECTESLMLLADKEGVVYCFEFTPEGVVDVEHPVDHAA